jgi:hypothetical protein
MLGWTALDRVSFMYDLGVNMDEKMTFLEYVDVMIAKAFAMLVGEVITPRNPARGTDFLHIDFHRTMKFMNRCRVRCDSLMRSLVCLPFFMVDCKSHCALPL